MENMSVLSMDDSYAERRKLFKNIWETAIQMDEKEPDNGNKSKVIKTLRVDEKYGINIGKSKKQRIKNLRTVCTRLLAFCDRQDAADLFYDDQMSDVCKDSNNNSVVILTPKKKLKKKRKKKKVQQTYSYGREPRQTKPKTSFELEVPDGSVTHRGTRPLRDMHSPREERETLIKKFLNERYNIEKAPVPATSASEHKLQVGDAPCKVVKKKQIKKKKVNPIPSPLVPPLVPPPPRVKSPHTKGVHKRSSKRKKGLVK